MLCNSLWTGADCLIVPGFTSCSRMQVARERKDRILIDLKEKSTAVKWHKHERSEYFGLIAKKNENKADLWERGYIAFDLQDMFK